LIGSGERRKKKTWASLPKGGEKRRSMPGIWKPGA